MLCGARRARHAGAVPSTDPPLDPPRLDVPMGATSGASVKLRTISMMMLLRTPSSSALQLTSSTVQNSGEPGPSRPHTQHLSSWTQPMIDLYTKD